MTMESSYETTQFSSNKSFVEDHELKGNTQSQPAVQMKSQQSVWKVLLIVVIIVLLVLILMLLVALLGMAGQILTQTTEDTIAATNALTSGNSNSQRCLNCTAALNQINTRGNSAQKLNNIVGTLSNLKDTSISTAGVIDDILLVVEELLELHNGSSALPTSCQEIKKKQPNSPSGVYIVATTDGTGAKYVHCNMEELCGSGGGWTRLAYLDMSDATEKCPFGFRLFQSGGVRVCGRATSSVGSCQSVQFRSNGISYSQVCGRVVGYQYGSTGAVEQLIEDIDSYYVNGVSITRGSPREHVWTLMSGFLESAPNVDLRNCPCSTGSTQQVQSFIGSNYFCESGNPGTTSTSTLYTSDPLWDGQGCGSLETVCCSAPGLPWFHRDYGNTTTTDHLELRMCGDAGTIFADTPVSYYEIYVK